MPCTYAFFTRITRPLVISLQLLGGQPENSLRGAGSGPDFRIGEQIFVDEHRNRLRVAHRRDTSYGIPRSLTDKLRIRPQDGLAELSAQRLLVHPVGPAGDHQQRPPAGGALHYQRLGNLTHLAADSAGCVLGAAGGLVNFTDFAGDTQDY